MLDLANDVKWTADRLTVNGERDLGFHGRGGERVAGLAAEARIIIARLGTENVNVSRFTTCRFVSVINLDFILVPDNLR